MKTEGEKKRKKSSSKPATVMKLPDENGCDSEADTDVDEEDNKIPDVSDPEDSSDSEVTLKPPSKRAR